MKWPVVGGAAVSWATRAVGALAIGWTPGCQYLFGFERIELAAPPPDASCEVPIEVTTGLRIGNLRAADGAIDLCVKPDGEDEYRSLPILDGVGSACPDVGYKQITAPLALDAGPYELKAVPSGQDCAERGLARARVEVEAGWIHSVLLLGGEPGASELVAFRDARAPASAT
ncbi:MAG: DUF4397 domain-containing protein [Polyangiaceae bacterium]|nr:DUF4397 domain-containing protein [Polyangiaceae bacterium]